MKMKKRKSNLLLNIILVIAILCFLGSGGYLLKYYMDGWQKEKSMDGLEALIIEEETKKAVHITESGEEETEEVWELGGRYKKLLEANGDFIGWVEIEDTELSYPVMYTPNDPEYYLHRNFEEEYEYSGLPFVDGNCTIDPASTNIIIYGHNMKNSTMFSRMLDYKSEDFYKEHPYITFNTIYGDGEYEIVAVILARALYVGEEGFRYYGMIEASSEEEFNEYMENIHALELYDTGVDARYGDQLLTLSTCEYSQENGRMAIIAKKIK